MPLRLQREESCLANVPHAHGGLVRGGLQLALDKGEVRSEVWRCQVTCTLYINLQDS